MSNLGTARAQRFHAYVERLSTALGHRDRHGPLRAYVTGLCLPGERKSIEPMAARVDPRHVRARHQSMHHFVANAAWDDGAVLRAPVRPCWRPWSDTARWRRGSSTTPACPRRAATRWAWPANIAACLANRTTARWR